MEVIYRIEVIRSPAAALCGRGKMVVVVNSITRPAASEWQGSFNTYYELEKET